MRKFSLISLLSLIICLAAGCQKEGGLSRESGVGDLCISLSSLHAEFETKAIPETPQEGYAFGDLLVVLTNDHGMVIDKVYKSYPYTPAAGDLQTAAGAWPQQDYIYFHNLEVGTYHAYAYANIGHVDWQRSGETIAEVEKMLQTSKRDNATVYINTDRTLREVAGGSAPAMPTSSAMLLTAQVTVPVGVSANEVEIDLLRPVVRLNVLVNNHTPYDLKIRELNFSQFNVSQTYLIPQTNAAGTPLLPAGAQYIDLPPMASNVIVPHVEDNQEAEPHTIYSTLLYESAAGEYKMSLDVELQDETLGYPTKFLGRNNYSANLLSPDVVLAMQPGETRTVMLVNPQNNGNGCMFGWDNNLGILFKRSPQIKAVSLYKEWIDNLVTQDGIEKYCLTLKRRDDGKFELYGGTHNLFDNLDYLTKDQKKNRPTGTDAMTIVAVKNVDANRSWSQIDNGFKQYLMRIYCNTSETENYDAYLWNHSSTQLRTFADATNQARQWIMYDVDFETGGVPLKYIEKGTNKVKTLTEMPRNKEFNVEVNVYYEDFETQFNFRVENTWWTDAGGHVSQHTFN